MFRYLTAGESHGPGLTAVIEGLPAGIPFLVEELSDELARRRLGFGRGPRMSLERDVIELFGGVRHGLTLGSPISVLIRNTEFEEKWSDEMSPHPGEQKRRLTTPRPGHADLVGMLKYDTHDARGILERASARETAARTAVGYAAKKLLQELGVSVLSHVIEIGGVKTGETSLPLPSDLEAIDKSPVRAFGRDSEKRMLEVIEAAKSDRDTLGGVIEVLVYGLVPGIGSHVHSDRRLDARLAEAVMSIQAIKGVEIGDGFESARRRGSEVHDEIVLKDGTFARRSNRAGGTEGGMSNGEVLRVKAAMKPISTVGKGLMTVDVDTKQEASAFYERSDVVAVPAAGVVGEAMVAIVVAQEIQRMFGGDTIGDLKRNWEGYKDRLESF